jgi:aryl-alcohol dehydrogenase-like predicted oxidoreductase
VSIHFAVQLWRFEDFAADDFRRTVSRFQGENFQKNVDLVAKVEEIAREKGCTPSQLALAWVLAQGEEIVPIPGTKRRNYLEENVGALNVKLTKGDLLSMQGAAAGQRYSEQGMKLIDAA